MGMGGQRHAPGPSPPGKTTVNHGTRGWMRPVTVWKSAENLASIGIRSPDRPARCQSLYRLIYPDPTLMYVYINKRSLLLANQKLWYYSMAFRSSCHRCCKFLGIQTVTIRVWRTWISGCTVKTKILQNCQLQTVQEPGVMRYGLSVRH